LDHPKQNNTQYTTSKAGGIKDPGLRQVQKCVRVKPVNGIKAGHKKIQFASNKHSLFYTIKT